MTNELPTYEELIERLEKLEKQRIVPEQLDIAKLTRKLEQLWVPDSSWLTDENNLIPIGLISPFAGGTTPPGWLLCVGTSLLTSSYPELFNVIGYVYGGAGSNFSLPDLRGRASYGASGSGVGHATVDTIGKSDGAVISRRSASHWHTDSRLLPTGFGGTIGGPVNNNDRPTLTNAGDAGRASSGNTFSHSHGDTTTIQDTPGYLTVNYIIKY